MRSDASAYHGGRSSRSTRCAALLAIVLGATACFDVHQTDPGALRIDDFDQGAFPADATYTPWMCYSFNPSTNPDFSCALDGDTLDGSAHSLRLDFAIADPPDGKKQDGGAGLITYATAGLYQDFTLFDTLRFDCSLESGVPPLPSNLIFYAVLGCSTVKLTDGSEPGTVYVLQSTLCDQNWRPRVLDLANFGFPDNAPQVSGGLASCLQRVDKVGFQVDAELSDGQSGAGTLKIDDVHLQ